MTSSITVLMSITASGPTADLRALVRKSGLGYGGFDGQTYTHARLPDDETLAESEGNLGPSCFDVMTAICVPLHSFRSPNSDSTLAAWASRECARLAAEHAALGVHGLVYSATIQGERARTVGGGRGSLLSRASSVPVRLELTYTSPGPVEP